MKQASLLFPPPNPNSSLLLLLLLTQVARTFDKFLNVVVPFRTRYVYDLCLQSKSFSTRITPNHTPKNLPQFYATHFWSFDNRNQQPASTSSITLCMNWEFNKGWLATETAGSSKCLKNNIKPIDLMKGLLLQATAATSPLLPACLPPCPVSLCQPQSSNYEWESLHWVVSACLPATPSKLEKQREREVFGWPKLLTLWDHKPF